MYQYTIGVTEADPGIKERGPGGVTGVCGRDLSGVQGQGPWKGSQGEAKPPEAESFLAFERQMEVEKLLSFPYFAASKLFMGVQYDRRIDKKPELTPASLESAVHAQWQRLREARLS